MTTVIALALLGLAIVLVVIPKMMGGMSLTVLTGSMEPGIQPGDIVVTKGVDVKTAPSLQIGQIITFLPYPDDPTLVTHRIISKTVGSDGLAFVTQGDNNNAPDGWGPVKDYQIRGQVLYVVPRLGYVRQWLGPYTQWIVVGVAVVLIGYAVVAFVSSFRRRPDQSKQPKHELTAAADRRASREERAKARRSYHG
ncbi:MAG: signal peptidase I [Propionibacteriaceae bacterium]|nr:signal peptidase I [Propionibacteriaceae bacterium]